MIGTVVERSQVVEPVTSLAPAPPSIGVSPRPPASRTTLRCPYCHEPVAPTRESVASCKRCRAVHHEACWSESRSCASCRGARSLEHLRRRRVERWLARVGAIGLVLGVLAGGLVLVAMGSLVIVRALPPFVWGFGGSGSTVAVVAPATSSSLAAARAPRTTVAVPRQ